MRLTFPQEEVPPEHILQSATARTNIIISSTVLSESIDNVYSMKAKPEIRRSPWHFVLAWPRVWTLRTEQDLDQVIGSEECQRSLSELCLLRMSLLSLLKPVMATVISIVEESTSICKSVLLPADHRRHALNIASVNMSGVTKRLWMDSSTVATTVCQILWPGCRRRPYVQ